MQRLLKAGLLTSLALALLVGVVGGTIAGPAVGGSEANGGPALMAAPPPAGTVEPSVFHVEKSPQQLISEWTPERMKNAKPMARLSGELHGRRQAADASHPRGPLAQGVPTTSGKPLAGLGPRSNAPGSKQRPVNLRKPLRSTPLAKPQKGTRRLQHAPNWTLPTAWADWYWSANVVKIYFVNESGGDSVCSGAVVAPDIVLTAAHCIYLGGFASDWVVVPGQWGTWGLPGTGTGYGAWAARDAAVQTFWTTNHFFPYDYGFLVMSTNGASQHIGNVVGTVPILANAPIALNQSYYWLFGYPGDGWFEQWDGLYPYSCWSPYTDYLDVGDTGYYEIGMGCYATAGASGGPKYISYQGGWYIGSVVSHGNNNVDPCSGNVNCWSINEYGPYFNNDTITLYNFALTL